GGDPAGPVVLMVHGWPDTHRVWDGVAEHLGDEVRLVAYDTRGQGASVMAGSDEQFTLDLLADDLLAVVDAVSPGRLVHVVGHDWGSVQAWEAVCRPAAASRIASFTSMSGPNLHHVAAWARRTLRHPAPGALLGLVGQAVSSSYVPFLVSPLAPPVLGALGTRDMVSGLRYYRANLGHWRHPVEQRTGVPVLQLALTRDPAVRPASLAASDPWTDTLERRELPHGHWAATTHPEVVAEHVRGWVRDHEPG
ncbi:MAG TPA: alpha/beta fold hydrolase, partial [Nocardioides sp.]|nr:alpha/beta fold hydrolase [Nocardioides sp.]